MQLLPVIQKLISFRTIAGNKDEIDRCLTYIQTLLEPTGVKVDIYRFSSASPVIFARNEDVTHFDALVVGHIDVVKAEDKMFRATLQNGKLYGRGSLDMKSFAAVAINSMMYVAEKKLPLKFGFIFSTDEEIGSTSLEAFLKENPNLTADVVLDNDVGGDISKIVVRCKKPVYVRLSAQGKAAHGSTPWEGLDANEQLFLTWQNIRKIYPAFSVITGQPKDTWTDTLHFATFKGGFISNVISDEAEALLDFRLTKKTSIETLKENLEKCMAEGVSFEITMQGVLVVLDEKNPILLSYKTLAENILEKDILFEYIGGATDSSAFYERGSIVIMHSGTGEGMHGDNEYVVFESVEKLADIQIRFLEKLAGQK